MAKKAATRVKKRSRSKQKGGQFERDTCVKLSHWLTGGKNKDVFWRSAMSGGRATVTRRTGQAVRQAGDICAVAAEGHVLTDRWFVELKHYRDLQLDRFLLQGTGILTRFWDKAREEARSHDKMPVLIVRQNGWPELLIMPDTAMIAAAPPRVAILGRGSCRVWILADFLRRVAMCAACGTLVARRVTGRGMHRCASCAKVQDGI